MVRDRPPLGLLVDRAPPAEAVELVIALARWARPVAAAHLAAGEHPAAWFATSPSAGARPGRGRPVAVWVAEGEVHGEPTPPGAVLVGPAAPDDPPHVRVRAGASDLARWHWFPPFVRARQRRRFGIPDVPFDVRPSARDPILRGDVPTALALAPAAVVDEEWLVVALALGTLCAVSEATGSAVAPDHGPDALAVGAPDELDELAMSLAVASDQARRSRAARALAATFDLDQAARRLARSLRIDDNVARDRVALRLTELGTPVGSFVEGRARAALGPFLRLDRSHHDDRPPAG
jgi:hypothetical protein